MGLAMIRAAIASEVTSAINIQTSALGSQTRLPASSQLPVASYQALVLTPQASREGASPESPIPRPNPEPRTPSPDIFPLGLHLAPWTGMLKRLFAAFGGKNKE